MNWDAIAAIGETVGAVAVLATLFYLALQIRQNNLLAAENTRRLRLDGLGSTFESFSQWRRYLSQADLATIYLKGISDYTALSDVERVQFGAMMDELLFAFKNMFERVNETSFDRDEFERSLSELKFILGRPGVAQWWLKNQHRFAREFIAEIVGSGN